MNNVVVLFSLKDGIEGALLSVIFNDYEVKFGLPFWVFGEKIIARGRATDGAGYCVPLGDKFSNYVGCQERVRACNKSVRHCDKDLSLE
jgi:hypothetical protein